VSRDVAPLGIELSTLGRVVENAARRKGLTVSPDPFPQEGFFLRADNYPFARAGIPALYMAVGSILKVNRPARPKPARTSMGSSIITGRVMSTTPSSWTCVGRSSSRSSCGR